MKIALIGATGFVGSHILEEALDRKHEVTAIVRRPERLPERAGLTAKKGDALDVTPWQVCWPVTKPSSPPTMPTEMLPTYYETIVAGAKAIIAATKKAGVKRLLVVGGAGSLEVAPGQQVIDQPDFPAAWKAGATGTREFLYLLRKEPDLDWTFLSPAAMLQPGERTGKFRLGGDQLLTDAEGQCRISLQDYAVAMIDELEEPRHIRQRFCVAY